MELHDHPLTGMVLRVRSIVDRPFRPTLQTPGISQQTFTANRQGKKGNVMAVLVLGAIPEHEDTTHADLVRVMDELGWQPKPGHAILAEVAREAEEVQP